MFCMGGYKGVEQVGHWCGGLVASFPHLSTLSVIIKNGISLPRAQTMSFEPVCVSRFGFGH